MTLPEGVVSASTLLAGGLPPVKWLWGRPEGGVLPEGDIAALASYSGKGKTTFAVALAAAASTRTPLLDMPVAGPYSTFILTETSRRQMSKLLSVPGPALDPERVYLHFGRMTAPRLAEAVSATKADILIVDTLTSMAPALGLHGRGPFDWFSPTHSTEVGQWFRRLSEECGLKLTLLLLHTKKPQTGLVGREPLKPTLDLVRGSGAVVEQLDIVWYLDPADDIKGRSGRWLKLDKDRTGEALDEIGFEYNSETGELYADTAEILTTERLIKAVSEGYDSTRKLQRLFHRRRESVVDKIGDMVTRGLLVHTGEGSRARLKVLDKTVAESVLSTAEGE